MLGFHIGLLVLGTLYVINSFINTCIYAYDVIDIDEKEEEEVMSESVKHMFI